MIETNLGKRDTPHNDQPEISFESPKQNSLSLTFSLKLTKSTEGGTPTFSPSDTVFTLKQSPVKKRKSGRKKKPSEKKIKASISKMTEKNGKKVEKNFEEGKSGKGGKEFARPVKRLFDQRREEQMDLSYQKGLKSDVNLKEKLGENLEKSSRAWERKWVLVPNVRDLGPDIWMLKWVRSKPVFESC